MADISEWDPVDDANTDAPPNGWPEFMQPSAVNNTARAMMGAVRRWYDTVTASLGNLVTAVDSKVERSGDTMSGPLAITSGNPMLTINKTVSTSPAQILGQHAGSMRWVMHLCSQDPETGGDAGSTFGLYYYHDNGSFAGLAMWGSRQTGSVTFNAPVVLAAGGVAGQHATRKDYVDGRDTTIYNESVNYTNGIYNAAVNYTNALHNSQQADIGQRVYKGGDTMSGGLTAAGLVSTGNLSVNGTAIAHDVMPSADNVSICGGAESAWNVVEAYNFITKSDAALKQDIGALPDALPLIAALMPKAFQYIGDDNRRHWGFVAQDVQAATSGYPVDLVTGEAGRLGLDHSGLVAALWKAVQELTDRVTALER